MQNKPMRQLAKNKKVFNRTPSELADLFCVSVDRLPITHPKE